MYRWFERYFAFSRRELIGICVLGFFLLAIGLFPMAYRLRSVPGYADLPEHVVEIERFLATVEVSGSPAGHPDGMPDAVAEHALAVDYFQFDPNGMAVVDWKRLGLSDRQVRMIKNYEAKGGRFRRKEDLKKIYAIHDADYDRLEPYIHIKAAAGKPVDPPYDASERKPMDWGDRADGQAPKAPVVLELNAVDSVQLQSLPGIGPVFASRIVRFRDRLGGFHDVLQLMDVYGFDSVRFIGLREQVYVDSSAVSKIRLNSASIEQLRAHPFISPKLANIIVQYRKQHGPYRSLDDLLNIAIMDDGIFRKIAPYLTIADD